jgi:DNA-binding response OmpR family regulator
LISAIFERLNGGMHPSASPTMLIVEDEPIISVTLTDVLTDHGMHVAGPFRANTTALAYLEAGRPDAAIIDINLLDGVSDRIAERLTVLGVPFIVISGASKSGRYAPVLESAEWLAKPFGERALMAMADHCLRRTASPIT